MVSILQARINEKIRVPEVRVIDAEGKMLGVMTTADAMALAREQGLDLIEVASNAKPPVAKILSYDKFRYQQEKAMQQQRKRQKQIEVKGVRISVRIGPHDLQFKADQAVKFLQKGNKVKVEMFLRGRERANLQYAFEMLKKFIETIPSPHVIEQEPKRLGGLITIVIAPKT